MMLLRLSTSAPVLVASLIHAWICSSSVSLSGGCSLSRSLPSFHDSGVCGGDRVVNLVTGLAISIAASMIFLYENYKTTSL
jgi:hypothetical protein